MSNQVYGNAVPETDPTEVKDSRTLFAQEHGSFLEKVVTQGGFADLYDARDVTEVVFRAMRDMMTNEAVDDVADELRTPLMAKNADKTLYTATPLATKVEDLWKDTNPIVNFLSRVRPTLKIDDDTFLFRVKQEAGLPPNIKVEDAVKAVFSATKAELTPNRVKEVAEFLPGQIQDLWTNA